MSAITENAGLNYDLDGTEPDYLTKLNENTLKIDAYLPLCVLAQIDLADLPLTPSDGDKYIVDSSLIYIRQNGQWFTFPMLCGSSFYDEELQLWFRYDGTNILLDGGPGGVVNAANVGTGVEIFRDKIDGVLNFKTLVAGSGATLDDSDPDEIVISVDETGFPSGTHLIFPQPSAPAGWTLDASENNRFLRIVDDVGGAVGGSFSNLSHSHSIPSHSHTLDDSAWAYISGEATDDTLPMRLTGNPGSWNSTRYADVNIITNPAPSDPQGSGVPLGGSTNSTSQSTNSASITHGSSQHAYLDAIICVKD